MIRVAVGALLLFGCADVRDPDEGFVSDGKADGWGEQRAIDVVMTEPFCDVCTAEDKTVLSARSRVTQKLISLIDGAERSIDIANYTFSVRTIEEALLRAKGRGVTVRLAMDKGQEMGDTAATRLRARLVSWIAGGSARWTGAPQWVAVLAPRSG